METNWNMVFVACIEFVAVLSALGFIAKGISKMFKKSFDENAQNIVKMITDQHDETIKKMRALEKETSEHLKEISTHYNRIAKDHDARLVRVESEYKDVDLTCRRTELLLLFHMTPKRVDYIMARYEAYKRHGGNTYIDKMYEDWFKKYAQDNIADLVGKSDTDDK